jgi:Flavin containing amine oxidoreductase
LIQFNTEITSIDINPSSQQKSITLKSTTNEEFHADSLIVTLPLGTLKSNTVKFTPELPPSVHRAISNLGFGVLEKLFIRFSKAWWLTPLSANESAIGLEFYRFTSLLSTLETSLPRGTLNFFSLARIHQPQPVFGIYVATDLAKYLVAMPKPELREMLQKSYIPHLPNYDQDDPECQILEIGSSQWSMDPLSGYGSYTHVPAGEIEGDGNMKVLGEMVFEAGDGGVWFAGEHTADTEVIAGDKYTTMATVTGAYKTGERAGKHVLEYYSKELGTNSMVVDGSNGIPNDLTFEGKDM